MDGARVLPNGYGIKPQAGAVIVSQEQQPKQARKERTAWSRTVHSVIIRLLGADSRVGNGLLPRECYVSE